MKAMIAREHGGPEVLVYDGSFPDPVVGAGDVVKIPEGVSYEDAAALPVAYGTALRMMYTNGAVKAGEKVLILVASGGVGICCVQLAKMVGAEVTACAGTDEKGSG